MTISVLRSLPLIALLCFCNPLKGQQGAPTTYVTTRLAAPENIDASQGKVVGSTAGTLSVNASGAATYEIPIQAVPGVAGMTPKISLVYNSQSGNGIAGYGWGIGGLSAITRTGHNYYHDGKVGPVQWNNTDHYVLDGQRLFPILDANGNPTDYFQTEVESWTEIRLLNPNTPYAWFQVTAKDGTIYEYGNSLNTSGTANNSCIYNNSEDILSWQLSKVTDINGNMIQYSYLTWNNGRENALQRIDYGDNVTSLIQRAVILFDYDFRSENNTSYVSGSAYKQSRILSQIHTYDRGTSNSTPVRSYSLSYFFDGIHSLLQSVTESGADGREMNPTQFLYGNETPEFAVRTATGLTSFPGKTSYAGDFNGDGYSDIVQYSYGYWQAQNMSYINGFDVKLFDPNNNTFDTVYHFTGEQGAQNISTSYPPHKYNTHTFDYDGDGTDDIIITVQNATELIKIYIFKKLVNSSPVIETRHPNTYNKYKSGTQAVFPGDFDGDGRMDFITMLSNGTEYRAFMTNSARSVFNEEIIFPLPIFPPAVRITNGTPVFLGHANDVVEANYISVIDFDGDGKDELFYTPTTAQQDKSFIAGFSRNTNGTWNANKLLESGYPNRWHAIFPGDFNGDGKTDILTRVWNNETAWSVSLSNGKSFIEEPLSFAFNPGIRKGSNGYVPKPNDDAVVIADFNGDGKSDILSAYKANSSTNSFQMYYSVGDNVWNSVVNHCSNSNVGSSRRPIVGDFTGNLKADILFVELGTNPTNIYSFKHSSAGDRSLTTIRSGLGLCEHITYLPLTTANPYHYNFTGITNYPFNNIKIGLSTVSTTSYSLANQSNFGHKYYRYEDLKLLKNGRGLMGFRVMFTHEAATGLIQKQIVDEYHQQPYTIYHTYVPIKTHTERGFLSNNIYNIHETNYSYFDVQQFSPLIKKYKKALSKTVLTNLLRNTTITTNYNTYDNYGNPTKITTNNAGIETTVTTLSYAPASATLTPVPAKPEIITETKTRSGAPSVSKTVKHTYQAGKIAGITDFYGASGGLITNYGYDAFGNVTSKYVRPMNTSAGRTETYQYDPTNRYVTATTNSLGQSSSRKIDNRWGVPLSETAFGNITTAYTYDGFGRLTSRVMPEGYTVYDSLKWSQVGNTINSHCYTHMVEDPSATNQYQHYTPLGKLRETVTRVWENSSGTGIFSSDITTYDLLNRPIETQTPAFTGESRVKTVVSYDPLGRIQQEERRDGTNNTLLGRNTYTYAYQNGNLTTTITDLSNRKKYSVTDPTGKVIETGDPSGVVTFQYDSWGNVTKTFTGGVLVSENTYDAYNRRKTTKESSSGTTQYEYSAYGEVVRQTDAAGNVSNWGYDDLGRPDYKQFPEGSIQYTYYNNATNGSGNKLWKETRRNASNTLEYELEYKYDALGRAYRITSSDGYTEYTFDGYGRVETTRYSSGIKLKNTYKCGLLHEILEMNGQRRYWLQDVNGLGKPKLEWRSNGKTTTNTYQYGAATRYETPGVQDYRLAYNWAKGLITRRHDGIMTWFDDFTYDNADRLEKAQGGVISPIPPTVTPPVQTQIYGTNAATAGNILSKSDIGSYGYSSLPHQMRYTDNAAGAIPLVRQDVKYASFHRPTEITEGLNKATFSYGTDDERVAMKFYNNNALQFTKTYFPDGVEKITNGLGGLKYKVTYVPGNDGIALIYVQKPEQITGFSGMEANSNFGGELGGPPEPYEPLTTDIYYPYTDHLGSIVALTNGTGTVVHRQAFDAWGRRRSPFNQQTDDRALPPAGFDWLRGYTGHEHLDSFGLINMNARLYDPKMGRMLSVDNYVSAPGTALGYNRYAYCLNNPVMYTDPSGNFLAIPFFAIGFLAEFTSNLIGGYSNAGGRAFNAVTQNMKEINSVARVGDGNFSIGLNPLAIGVDVQFGGKIGNTSISGGVGIGLGGVYAGGGVSQQIGNWQLGLSGGTNGTTYSAGGGFGYDDGKTALSYYLTYYGGGVSPTGERMNQWVGGIGFRSGDFGLRLENDFLARMGGDAWRTQALQFSVGDFEFGSYIYTNDGAKASGGDRDRTKLSPLWKGNGRPDGKGDRYAAWSNGQVFKAPAYIGYRSGTTVSRTGWSTRGVQDLQQNWMHQTRVFPPGNQNYYLNYDYFQGGLYRFGGYANPYSLFGF